MITGTILRLLAAGGLGLLGAAILVGDTHNLIGIALLGIAFVWGTILLFILSAQLIMYGLSGIAHDIDRYQEHDPWNRW